MTANFYVLLQSITLKRGLPPFFPGTDPRSWSGVLSKRGLSPFIPSKRGLSPFIPF
jgi:hypothetical protein